MMKKDLFSLILLHYNQPDYVLGALDSVLCQDYESIELIFADDASRTLDLDNIKNHIEKNKRDNIESVKYVINEQNQGTVKTVNRAVKAATGKYILFFAADDALCDSKVLSNFADAFSKAQENVYMISAQCYMMDKDLKKWMARFVSKESGEAFNRMSAHEQFTLFTGSCFLAIGATAMRRDMFERFGYFNENYKYVEDWAYYLHLTRSGGLIRYADFNALLHRDGGISHNDVKGPLPEHVLQYRLDMISIFEGEILAHTKQLGLLNATKAFLRYEAEKKAFVESGGAPGRIHGMSAGYTAFMKTICAVLGLGQKGWKATEKAISFTAFVFAAFAAAAANEFLYPGFVPAWALRVFQIAAIAAFAATALVFALSVMMKLLRKLKNRRK